MSLQFLPRVGACLREELAHQVSCCRVLSCCQIAALQTVSGSDQAALDCIPSDALLAAAAGFPPGSVTKMESNIDAALSGDTKSISMLRSLKLYLERMGADQQVCTWQWAATGGPGKAWWYVEFFWS